MVRIWSSFLLITTTFFLSPTLAFSQSELRLSTAATTADSVSLSMSSPVALQAINIALSFDPSLVKVLSYAPSSIFENDLVIPNIFAGGFTLQLLPEAPLAGESIVPPSENLELGQLFFEANQIAIDQEILVAIEFASGAMGDPAISNELIDLAGNIVDATSGLQFYAGSVTIPIASVIFELSNADGLPQNASRVYVDSNTPLDGMVIALSVGPGLEFSHPIATDVAGVSPDFVAYNFNPYELTVNIIMDVSMPPAGKHSPIGRHQVLELFYYCDSLPEPPTEIPVSFSTVLGKSNMASSFGVPITPLLIDGLRTCGRPILLIGDSNAPQGVIRSARSHPGGIFQMGAFLISPEANAQGVQVAIALDPHLLIVDVNPTPLVSEIAEFVNYNLDTNLFDGDGYEFVIGILLDALPPFEGQLFPQIGLEPLKLVVLDIELSENATPAESYDIILADDINGLGDVPISNVVIQDYQTAFPTLVHSSVETSNRYIRGDSNRDAQVNLADAIELLAILFALRPTPDCLAACDVNNDELIDIADAINLYSFIYLSGSQPISPYPECSTISYGLTCFDNLSCP